MSNPQGVFVQFYSDVVEIKADSEKLAVLFSKTWRTFGKWFQAIRQTLLSV